MWIRGLLMDSSFILIFRSSSLMIGLYDRDRIQPLFSWKEIEMGNGREKFGVTIVMKKGIFFYFYVFPFFFS